MRGHDHQAGGLPADEHHNGQSGSSRSSRRRATSKGSGPPSKTVLRRIDPGSVLKVSILFYAAMYCILLVAAVLLWLAATATGLRSNVEDVIADLIASGQFHFVGSELLQAGAVGGALLVVFGTGANVMLAVLYNLITDMVGGVSIVVEERPARRPRRTSVLEPEPAGTAAKAGLSPGPEIEPARRPEPEPVAAITGEGPRILIPEVELRQARSQPLPASASGPDGVGERRSDVESGKTPNLDAFGL